MRASRIDNTHRAIQAVFESHGWEWESLAAVGRGVPDGMTTPPDRSGIFLIEAKSGDKARTKPDTAKRQADFAARFPVVRLVSAEHAEQWIRIQTT